MADVKRMTPPQPDVDLRGPYPKENIDVLDAVSAARKISRWDLCVEILDEWVERRMRETISIVRITGVTKDSGFGDMGPR